MLFLTIISPEKILFKGNVENVLVPGINGGFVEVKKNEVNLCVEL